MHNAHKIYFFGGKWGRTVLLCLYEWGAHEHPSLTATPRARALVGRLEEEPHVNPNTGTMEFSLRDPDGYYVTISALNPA